jgi:drug/metabolite transporter (DMT)-like permease
MGTLAVPVIGVLAAWVQLHETPSLMEGAGMALIIAGLAALAAVGISAGRGGGQGGADEPALLPVID